MNGTVTYRRLVMPKDLNAANRLFGGQMMAWIDEAAAMYAMCVTQSKNIVTKKISEITFDYPVCQGDFLVFSGYTIATGRTSITVQINVLRKDIGINVIGLAPRTQVASCQMIFVTIDPETGKPVPHDLERIET